MVTPLESAIGNILNTLSLITPAGFDPFIFWSSFFIILSTVYYATMQIPYFKRDGDKVNPQIRAIGIILSLMLAYFGAINPQISQVVSDAFPNIGLLLIAMFSFILVAGLAIPSGKETDSWVKTYVLDKIVPAVFMGAVLLIILQTVAGPNSPLVVLSPTGLLLLGLIPITDYTLAMVIIIALFILIFVWVFRPDKIGLGKKSTGGS